MPNRYLPSALTDMIQERRSALQKRVGGKGDDSDEYVSESEALVAMLQPEYQREYRRRRGELDDG